MWFKKKEKPKEYLIRTKPPCVHKDCLMYREFYWTFVDDSKQYLYCADPLLTTCLFCTKFVRTNNYTSKEEKKREKV